MHEIYRLKGNLSLLVLLIFSAFTVNAQEDYKYKASNWAVGFMFGYERDFFAGNVDNYFSTNEGLSLAFEFDRKQKYRFGLSGVSGNNKVLQSFSSPQRAIEIFSGQKSNFTLIELYAGKIYQLKRNSSLTPTIGLAISEFTLAETEPDSEGGILSGFSPSIGTEFDYVFAKRERISKFNPNVTERVNFVLKAKTLVSITNFKTGFNGLTFSGRILIGLKACDVAMKPMN